MGDSAARFKAEVLRRLDTVLDGQEDALHQAATIFANTIERGGIIRAFGSGHSHANALEICGRAGGYIQTKVVREPAWGIYEMIDGVGDQFWLKLDLRPEDCLVVISNSGRNPLPIELAQHAQEAGVPVIAVTALEVSRAGTSRAKSGKLLYHTGCLLLDCAVMESLDILLERGVQPPLFMSANVDGGPEFNQRLLDQFKERLAEY